MRANGWQGVVRAKKVRTTEPDPGATRAPDLVDRQFTVPAPNVLVVADFTLRLSTGAFVYTAFAIDAFAGRIVGWQCSGKHTVFVESAIRQAASLRRMDGKTIDRQHYSSLGCGLSIHLCAIFRDPHAGWANTLDRDGGDAYDKRPGRDDDRALQDRSSAQGLTFRRGPLDRLADVELLTADWVHWYNTSRLMHRLGHTPVEYEAAYYAQRATAETEAHQ